MSASKKSTNINLGPETARWGGGFPREGAVAEKFVPSLKGLSSLGFEERNLGCPGNFAGMSLTAKGAQKVCAKKVRAHFSFPNVTSRREGVISSANKHVSLCPTRGFPSLVLHMVPKWWKYPFFGGLLHGNPSSGARGPASPKVSHKRVGCSRSSADSLGA